MASMIQVWRKYGPRIEYGPKMEAEETIRNLIHATGLTRGQVYAVLYEIETVKVWAATAGRSMQLPNGDLYRPVMRRDGSIDLNFIPNAALLKQINSRFHGKVINAQNKGKTDDQMVDFWNERHPDDPVQGL